MKMARPEGETSNSLFQALGEWSAYLQQIMRPGQPVTS